MASLWGVSFNPIPLYLSIQPLNRLLSIVYHIRIVIVKEIFHFIFRAPPSEYCTFPRSCRIIESKLDQTYINDGKYGKAHQLAVALLQGQLSYPTVVFLTKQDNKFSASPVPGFRQPREMEVLLSFFANKAYETQGWEDFQKTFKGKIE